MLWGAVLAVLAGATLALVGVVRDDATLVTVASSAVVAESGSTPPAARRDDGGA